MRDNIKTSYGTDEDSFTYWDGTNQIWNTTTGILQINNNSGSGTIGAGRFLVNSPEYSDISSNLETMKNPNLIIKEGKTENEFHLLFPEKVVTYIPVKDLDNCWQELDYTKWCLGVEYDERVYNPNCTTNNPNNNSYIEVEVMKEECETKIESRVNLGEGYLDNYGLIYQLKQENEAKDVIIADLKSMLCIIDNCNNKFDGCGCPEL